MRKRFKNEEDVPKGWKHGGANQFGIKRTAGRKWYHDSNKTTKMYIPGSQPEGWILCRI